MNNWQFCTLQCQHLHQILKNFSVTVNSTVCHNFVSINNESYNLDSYPFVLILKILKTYLFPHWLNMASFWPSKTHETSHSALAHLCSKDWSQRSTVGHGNGMHGFCNCWTDATEDLKGLRDLNCKIQHSLFPYKELQASFLKWWMACLYYLHSLKCNYNMFLCMVLWKSFWAWEKNKQSRGD